MSEQGEDLVYESGEWQVHLGRRELRAGGVPVPIGARAFEIVEVLVRSANELVSKDDLMDRVWRGTTVGENTLQVHISAIRKALGRDRAMLNTASGRGYRMLGRWTARRRDARSAPVDPVPSRANGEPVLGNLPFVVEDLIGRDATLRRLRDLMSAYRTVTLTGPAGIGKTRLGLEIARVLSSDFDGGAWLVELAALSDPGLVAATAVNVLSLRLPGSDISPEALARAIGGRKLLLVIDNCEHIIDAAAKVAEAVMHLCPAVSVLATSREPLRVEGEATYRVPPLDYPGPEVREAGQDQILRTSAVQLFVARLNAWEPGLPRHEELSTIAAICRRLDGIPLAIEFAAARAATLGLNEVHSGLDDRFALLTSGRRTALPKNRTLRATLDWSHELLSGAEQRLLRRLGIFAAAFSLEAAIAVTAVGVSSAMEVADGVANLVAKSLVTADNSVTVPSFQLLETTRAYAMEKLIESGEVPRLAREHAAYYQGLLEKIVGEGDARTADLAVLGNARAALEWCFDVNGEAEIGIGLAVAAAPIFLAMAMLVECHRWSERAILAFDATMRGGSGEMHLRASFGAASMHMYGQSGAARAALDRSLAIAEARGDVRTQVNVLGILSMFHTRAGDFAAALNFAKRSRVVAGTVEDAATMALAQSILGRPLHFMGDHFGARVELEASFRYWSRAQRTSDIYLGFDHLIVVGLGLARTLWLQGYPAQAAECARQLVRDAEGRNHPASLAVVLSWVPGVFLWIGDLRAAEDHTDRLIAHAQSHSLAPYLAVARGYQGAAAIQRGDSEGGVESVQFCVARLRANRYELRNTEFTLSLVEGLTAIGQPDAGMTLVDETIRRLEASGEQLYLPEALRLKGRVLLAMPDINGNRAEQCFRQSLDLSHHQGARAWELRTGNDLATLLASRGEVESARSLLRPVFERFTEGLDSADLKAADRLLATLDQASSRSRNTRI